MLLCATVQESTLPLDAACDPVHAWRFNQANTIFQVGWFDTSNSSAALQLHNPWCTA